eukprot:TRINITY_DN23728_c0_g4_i1.p1 TRINITY_DN23728_c0_g4~~TRINITY_DN23728_c0_g4_i1.p1  ORF type:complete len:655 (+),score=88.03 TRINITY_DN23728_c0_g4_i1:143-2107(+)
MAALGSCLRPSTGASLSGCPFLQPLRNVGTLRCAKKHSRDSRSLSQRGFSQAAIQNRASSSSSPSTSMSGDLEWEKELFEGIDPLGFQPPRRRRKHRYEESKDEGISDNTEWASRSRRLALAAIRDKGFAVTEEDLIPKMRKKKRKNKKRNRKLKLDLASLDLDEDDSDVEEESAIANDVLDEFHDRMMSDFREKIYCSVSEPSDRKKEFTLNRAIVEASTADDVLAQVSEVMEAVIKGLRPSPLSPFNMATALHRIAKHMENVYLMQTNRLAFARQRDMAVLVSNAMAALPECSAQGIANIAWALSKIGGELLYWSEMDRIAEVAVTRVSEFNAQNVANLAGSFAAMQHSSSVFFLQLADRASALTKTFKPRELAQFLWAYASLYQAADPFLDSLDSILISSTDVPCVDREQPMENIAETTACSLNSFNASRNPDAAVEPSDFHPSTSPVFDCFNRNELAKMAWSYAVFNQMNRPFFKHIWKKLQGFEMETISSQLREDVVFSTQIYRTNQCLKLEYPHLQMSLETDVEESLAKVCCSKKFNSRITSLFQKQVARLLVSTGYKWEREYFADGYILDAVISDKRVALEIDGPTHFARNTGTPLGHTMLKQRYLTSAGWNVVSLSWKDWEDIYGESQQMEYLRRLLNEALQPQKV